MKKSEVTATGRRKRSVAQVKLVTGKGKITVNGRDVNEYMPFPTLVMDLKQPLVLTNNENTLILMLRLMVVDSLDRLELLDLLLLKH